MKTLGIIGGFGPQATAKFYLRVIQECRRQGLRAQPHIIVWNVAVPKKLEDDLLLHASKIREFIPLLKKAAKNLELAGAQFIVLPCNTLHTVIDTAVNTIKVPFLGIVESTIIHLRNKGVRKIGILGTSVTVRGGLFANAAGEIVFHKPDFRRQKSIDRQLHLFVQNGESRHLSLVLNRAVSNFQKHGINNILIACTDFHGLVADTPGITLHDTLDILANVTGQKIIGRKIQI